MENRKATKEEIVGNALGAIAVISIPIIAGILIYIELKKRR